MQINKQKYTKEEIYEFYNFFSQNHTLSETAIHFNVKYKTMINSMIRFGLYVPKRICTKRKNNCTNHDYFEKIDSHEKAYYLGLLMSDGYILTTNYNKQMGIALQLQDEYVLEPLKNNLGKNLKLNRYKNSSKLVVNSEKIYSDLVK